jgi:tetratricopeptide (TPR) repeat protein
MFVQTDGKTPRVRAVGVRASDLGCTALTLSKAGKKAAAKQWLTWAKDLFTPASGDDPLRESPFVRLWADNKDDVETAAAALCAEGGHPDLSAPVLAAARKAAKGDRAQILSHALVLAHSDGDHDNDLLSHAAKLSSEVPTSQIAWRLHSLGLRKLGRFKELRDLAAARVAKEPNDPLRLDDLASAEDLLGHSKEARAAGDKLLALGKYGAYAYNNQAWRSLFGGGVGKIEIGWALQAVTLAPNEKSFLNTLAALDAEAGHVADGLEQFQKSVDGVDEADLGGSDWFVYARLAEQLGLTDEARATYLKITPRPREYGEHTAFKLAERRLGQLKL